MKKMSAQEIQDIIEDNPDLTYEDIKKQAVIAGVNLEQFNEAWHAYLMRTRKPPASKLWGEIFIFALFFAAIIGFDIAYWHLVLEAPTAFLGGIIGKTALFAAFILMLHVSSKFAGGKATIFVTAKLSLFFLAAVYLAHYASQITSAVTYIIILFGGVLIGFFLLYAVARAYNIEAIRTIILTILCSVLMALIIEFTMGLTVFSGYFQSEAKNVQLESVIDIAEEKVKDKNK